jgi:hypothetical protein
LGKTTRNIDFDIDEMSIETDERRARHFGEHATTNLSQRDYRNSSEAFQ